MQINVPIHETTEKTQQQTQNKRKHIEYSPHSTARSAGGLVCVVVVFIKCNPIESTRRQHKRYYGNTHHTLLILLEHNQLLYTCIIYEYIYIHIYINTTTRTTAHQQQQPKRNVPPALYHIHTYLYIYIYNRTVPLCFHTIFGCVVLCSEPFSWAFRRRAGGGLTCGGGPSWTWAPKGQVLCGHLAGRPTTRVHHQPTRIR